MMVAMIKFTAAEIARLAETALVAPTKAVHGYIENMFSSSLMSLSAVADQSILCLVRKLDAATGLLTSDEKKFIQRQYKNIDLFKMAPMAKLMELVYRHRQGWTYIELQHVAQGELCSSGNRNHIRTWERHMSYHKMNCMPCVVQEMMNGSIKYLTEGLSVDFKRKMYITADVHLAFDKHAVGIATMYFSNHTGLAVPIPTGVRVVKDGTSDVVPVGDTFILSWDHNYSILVNDRVFYTLHKQKQHAVRGPVSREAKDALAAGAAAYAALAAQEAAQVANLDIGEDEAGDE